MDSPSRAWKRRLLLLFTEPTVHFFAFGALLFLAHRLIVGDPRVIVVSPGVKTDLERRFRDRRGRPPSGSELDVELRGWKRDEALYREALRDRLDRDDSAIRTILADRVRARAALGVANREPSGAELQQWLAAHRSRYETPRRYDYQSVAFPKAQPPGDRESGKGSATLPRRTAPGTSNAAQPASEQLEKYAQALKEGADPSALGRPIVGGDLTAQDLQQRFGVGLAARVQGLPIGRWQRLESQQSLLLVRLNAVEGGLPRPDELHQRLVADWSFAQQQQAVDEAVQAIVGRYRFEVRR
jgi:hypothetical protein